MQRDTRSPPPRWRRLLDSISEKNLSTLCAQGFPRMAAKHALAYASGDLGDARDLLVHQSHIRGWEREALITGVHKDKIKPTRLGRPSCNICGSLRVLRDAGGVRPDNAAYKLYASRHVVRTSPPPGTELQGPTGEGWIAIPSSSGRGFYIVDPEMTLDEGPGADGEGDEARKRIEGDGGWGNPRWGDGEYRPHYFETSVAGMRFATRQL